MFFTVLLHHRCRSSDSCLAHDGCPQDLRGRRVGRLGLSVDLMPGAYRSVPAMLLPAFTSSLSVATLSALLLNLLFRIGIAQHAKLQIDPRADSSDQIFVFMEKQGGGGVRAGK